MYEKRRILLLLCFFITLAAAYARAKEGEKETPVHEQRGADLYMLNYNKFIQYGFYPSAIGQAAHFSGGWGVLFGQRAALLVDHIFAIGAGYEVSLYASRGRIDGDRTGPERYTSYIAPPASRPKFLYGGGYIAYHIFSEKIVNFSLGALAGWGRLGQDYAAGHGSTFFILEPELYLFVNLPRYARIGVGTSYRISWGVNYRGITDRDFRGFSLGLQIQAGFL
ncbi:MAG: hypothetical protein A2176_15385 [Spirochaetes bacterium RBG_13_51_14]|nr:MAG: hypothetical protein A2176_15385 [Spirochaetes bacterium RBG_13_51_14]